MVVAFFEFAAQVLNHRVDQLAFQLCAIEAELALAAHQAAVDHALFIRHSLYQHAALGVQVHGAAHRAVGARGIGYLGLQRNGLLDGQAFSQSTGGAYADALAAGYTARFGQRHFQTRLNYSVETSVHQTQGADAHDLVANAHAQAAEDALVGVAHDKRMLILVIHLVNLSGKARGIDIVLVGKVDQLTFVVIVAAALQAAVGIGQRLLFGVAAVNDFAEIILSLCRRQLIGHRTALPLSVLEGFSRNVGSLHRILRLVFHLFAVQISVDDIASLSGIRDGFDGDGNLVVSAVAAGKYAGNRSHKGSLIVDDTLLLRQLQAFEAAGIYRLADG